MCVTLIRPFATTNRHNQVLRCPQSFEDQCRFFLWEKDEPAAREKSTSHNPQVPRTPIKAMSVKNESIPGPSMLATPPGQTSAGKDRIASLHLPTPNSNGDTSRETFLRSLDMSPTPRRFNSAEGTADDDVLSTSVLEVLRSNNVDIRASVEVLLRHTINSTIEVYVSKLQTSQQTISELCNRLNGLEYPETRVHA